jgi:hypothetical protein
MLSCSKGTSPAQWKFAQIILILKPGNPPNQLTFYRQISLLPIVSKVFKKLLLKRLLPIVEIHRLIPNHQFGFMQRLTFVPCPTKWILKVQPYGIISSEKEPFRLHCIS